MLFSQLIRAIQLEPQVFRELAQDKASLVSAMALALFSSAAAGVGSVGGYAEKIPQAIGTALLAWFLWVLLIYALGAKCFPAKRRTSLTAILCAAGFASTPGLLRFLAYFPVFSVIVSFGAALWMFASMLVAMKEALHYESMPRTAAVIGIGWIAYQWLLITL